LDAWLWRAVVNEAKRVSARPTTVPTDVAVEQTANGAAHSDAAVRTLIGSLPERQRHAVFLRYYADLDYRTIADVLEIEVGSVSATLHAAHATLRGAIEGVRS
jgi:RNA polymerase sigma factor (sigma-70 family)